METSLPSVPFGSNGEGVESVGLGTPAHGVKRPCDDDDGGGDGGEDSAKRQKLKNKLKH